MSKKELRDLHVQLQGQFPTLHPTVLQITSKLGDGEWGDCGEATIKGHKFLMVRVSSLLDEAAATFALIHEYAHAMEWRPEHQHGPDEHTAEWGVCEARVWKWYSGR